MTEDTQADLGIEESSAATKSKPWWQKLVVLSIVAAVAGLLYWQFGHLLSLQSLAEQETQLIETARQNPAIVLGVAFVIYVCVASLPVAALFTMGIAFLCNRMFEPVYGQWVALLIGVVVVSFASTTGATAAFLMSRYLLRDSIQNRFGDRLQKFNEALEREGAFYLFTLRLIPAVPFFIINPVMGLTPIRVWTFWWVSQIGMLAGTCVFVYAGTQLPGLKELAEKGAGGVLNWQLFLAFALLGLFPLVVKKIMARVRPSTPEPSAS